MPKGQYKQSNELPTYLRYAVLGKTKLKFRGGDLRHHGIRSTITGLGTGTWPREQMKWVRAACPDGADGSDLAT